MEIFTGIANGHRAGTETDHWRDEAINEALNASAYADGNCSDAILRAVRRHQPDAATLTKWLDRPLLLRFLEQNATERRRLLRGTSQLTGYGNSDGLNCYFDWLSARWEGLDLEVILPPGGGSSGWMHCILPNEQALARLSGILDDYTIRPTGHCLRFSGDWESAEDMDVELGKVTWDDIVLAPALLAQVRESVEGFFHHREAFAALGFAWRRGILLIGPPGTGKTMVCKAAAAATGLPFLYVRDLRERGQGDAIQTIFERARRLAPCILAFEDMDGMVNHGNRSVFLNELDGFQNNEGLLIIASSNHPGKIDEALLKRPSRFDRVFHIGMPGPGERREYCRRLLSRSMLADRITPGLDIDTLAHLVAENTDGFTPAYLKEVFVAAALQRAQDGANQLDEQFANAVLDQVTELRAHLKRLKDPDALAEISGGSDAMSLRR